MRAVAVMRMLQQSAIAILFVWLAPVGVYAENSRPINYPIRFDSLERPITADKVFEECHRPRKVGTSTPRLCEVWNEHFAWLEGKLADLCKDAGESIFRTAQNVRGLLVETDPESARARPQKYLHEDDGRQYSWLDPYAGRHFRYVEVQNSRGLVRFDIKSSRSETLPSPKTVKTKRDSPSARFGLRYESILSDEERRQGLFGDRTEIYDRKSGTILARRVVYYFAIDDAVRLPSGERLRSPERRRHNTGYIATCLNSGLTPSKRYKNGRPRNSSSFALRVISPPKYSKAELSQRYHLYVGSGLVKQKKCRTILIGPTVGIDNIILTGRQLAPIVAIEDTNDMLICKSTRNTTDPSFWFADGYKKKYSELIKEMRQ